MKSIGRDPIFIASAQGAELTDVDGNRYVDWVSSWGPLICGHAERSVVDAVIAAARKGTSYGAPTEGEVDLAAEIGRRVPSAEMVRMTSSGTEAAMSAIRLARAATGRDAILDSIEELTGITERATLYSSTEFKKIRLLYFTEDFKRWEAEHS